MSFMAKIVIFSDTHLTDKFDEKKFNFIKEIINEGDQVIIDGDFWDGRIINFNEFISSPWQELFPLLKNKNTVYVYGNHDKKSRSDQKTSLFSRLQTESYTLQSGEKTFIIEHGNRLNLAFDRLVDRLNPPKLIEYVFDFWENTMLKLFGKDFFRWFYRRFNNEIKSKIGKEVDDDTYYVFGHTHCAEIDLENHFIDGGFIRHGLGQYLLIEDGNIQAKERWYAMS